MSKFLNILIRMRLATGLSESGRLAVVRCRGRWGLMAAWGEGHSLLTTLNIVHVLQKKQVNLCLDKTILSIWYIYIIQQIQVHVYNSIQFRTTPVQSLTFKPNISGTYLQLLLCYLEEYNFLIYISILSYSCLQY